MVMEERKMAKKKKINVTLIGTKPMIMHSGQLADPLNPIVKEMKKITAKGKNKTDSDLEQLARLEFVGGLYVSEDKKSLVIPAHVLDGVIKTGAKASRKGKLVDQGIYAEEGKFTYTGPKNFDELFESDEHRFTIGVVVQRNRVFRTRPIFKEWSVSTTFVYDEDIVNREDVIQWLQAAGEYGGIGDWRPRYGGFKVEVK
jgi:hypothetical protein